MINENYAFIGIICIYPVMIWLFVFICHSSTWKFAEKEQFNLVAR